MFGKYLKSVREKNNYKLREMAALIGISHSYLSEIENNRKPPPNDKTLEKIVYVLNLQGDEKTKLYELAAKSKNTSDYNNYHLPLDIAKYVLANESVKHKIREQIGKK